LKRKTFDVVLALVLVLGFSLLGTGPATAGTLEVGTGKPYATIQAAITAATTGDTVLVYPGTYPESIVLKSGVVVQSSGGAGVTWIQGDGSIYASWEYTVRGADNSTITGFNITGTGGSVGVLCHESSPAVIANIIQDAGYGVFCLWSSAVIEDNLIQNHAWSGIQCYQSSATITDNVVQYSGQSGINCYGDSTGTIAGNTIQDNGGGGISCYEASPAIIGNIILYNDNPPWAYGINCKEDCSSTIANNVIYGNGYGIESGYDSTPAITNNTIHGNDDGIHCTDTASPTVTNNIVESNTYDGIICSGSSSPTLSYNNVWSNGSSDYSGCAAGSGGISSDPQFVSPATADYHLQEGSLCINAGKNSALGLPTTDFDGNARIQQGIVDMGAFESPFSSPVQPVSIDIRPQSCPNPLNVGNKGILPVAILGSEAFDVTQIDPATVRLQDVAPLRWALKDVAGPACSDPDGYLDLTTKFKTQEIVASLGDVYDGDVLGLTVTGNLKEAFGTIPIAGTDNIQIIEKR